MSRRIMQTGKIPGIGQKTERKLRRLGITNLPKPPFTSLGTLKSHFGASGGGLQHFASGIYERADYASSKSRFTP